MLKLSLRGIATHKLRTALTAIAIVLGVTMISGTLVLSDTVNRAFDRIFEQASAGVDVTVVPRQDYSAWTPQQASFDEDIVEQVREVDGVEVAEPIISDETIRIFDAEGERVGPDGPPHIAISVVDLQHFPGITYEQGRQPREGDEVAIDRDTVDAGDFELGGQVRVAGGAGARAYELVGVFRFGEEGASLGGASLAELTLAEAQRLTGREGEAQSIAISAAAGVDSEELRERVAERLADREDLEVRTGAEDADQQSEQVKEFFSFVTIALLVFAGIAVFVGAFLIFNTFSIIVAQRTREFAMLRTLGASRRQVLAVVGLEALAIALVASMVGLAGGFLYVPAITAVFDAFGFALPGEDPAYTARSAIIGLSVGLATTAVAAAVPAVRATRVSPLEALREAGGSRRRRRRWVDALGAALVAAGGALLVLGLFGAAEPTAALSSMGGGLALLFIGVGVLSPHLVGPLARLVGWPLERVTKISGRLARENAVRLPGRTATTASALMIGVALVTFVAVFASALTRSFDDALDRAYAGDLTVRNADGFSNIPAAAAEEVGEVEGVAAVASLRWADVEVTVGGETDKESVGGIDPRTLPRVFSIDWTEGDDRLLAELGSHEAIARESWAEANEVEVGDTVTVRSQQGGESRYTVRGIFDDPMGLIAESFAIPNATLESEVGIRDDYLQMIGFEPGAEPTAVRERIDERLGERFPTAESESQQELKDSQREQINQLLGLIYGLLALSIIVSVFGVVNTMTLAIRERMREIGVLRAIGSSRWQVRSTIASESVITALLGGVLGLGLGVLLAVLAVAALSDEGLVLAIPVPTLAAVLVLAALAGVLASILPARRAARTDVLEAIAYE